MRYSETEITTLVGQFSPGQTVTIKLIELSNDALVTVTSDVCVESLHIPGMYLWKTNNMPDSQVYINAIIGICSYQMPNKLIFKIDGELIELNSSGNSNCRTVGYGAGVHNESNQLFLTTINFLKKLINANDVFVKWGPAEGGFSKETMYSAKKGFKNFLAKLPEYNQ